MIYKFAPGFRLKANPEVVGKHLEKIEAKNGGLNSKLVLEDARSPKSPLHQEFDWEDPIAAERWRESQAQYILRSVVAVITTADGDERIVRAFVNLEKNGGHVGMKTVLASQALTEQLLEKALRELRAWHLKYSTYKELAHLCGVIDRNLKPFEETLVDHKISEAKSNLHAQA